MKFKLLPPFLFLFCCLLMFFLTVSVPQLAFLPTPYNYFGFVLFFVGLSIVRKSQLIFKAVDTEINTFKPPKRLVTDGLFRYSRNPIYLGFTLALLGWAMVLGNLAALDGVLLFFLAAHFWYIPFEEKAMKKEFGTVYEQYKKQVRRWL